MGYSLVPHVARQGLGCVQAFSALEAQPTPAAVKAATRAFHTSSASQEPALAWILMNYYIERLDNRNGNIFK